MDGHSRQMSVITPLEQCLGATHEPYIITRRNVVHQALPE